MTSNEIFKFEHFLNFIGLPQIGMIQIAEPFGFDGSSHKIAQDEGRFGRDVIIGDEEIELSIYRDNFELLPLPQILPDGVEFNHASHGFDYVASEIKNKGWECEIEYIIKKDGILFNTGIIDGFTTVVLEDEIKFKVIQNTKREEIKRREDIYVNAFNDKDLDDEPITPCSTTNILLKAKPIYQVSKWKGNGIAGYGFSRTSDDFDPGGGGTYDGHTVRFGANNADIVEEYGIENTLSFMSSRFALNGFGFPNNGLNFTYIEALEQMSDVNINITDVVAYTSQVKNDFFTNIVLSGSGYARLVVKYGYDGVGDDVETIELYRKDFGFVNNTPVEYLPTSFTANIPLLQKGQRVWIYLEPYTEATFNANGLDSLAGYEITSVVENMKVEINGVSTGIDSVINGVRLIDLMKHNVLSVGGVPLTAPIYDVGGEHYDNFAFNGYLLGQITDKPFNNRFKDITDIPQELCADYQINPDGVEIRTYGEYYTNTEIQAFLELPDEKNESPFNKRFFLKEFWFGYNKSSDARQSNGKNTIDDVHTDTQWMPQSKKTDGVLKININHSRSAYLIEEQRRRATKIEEKTTSLQYDESLFLLDCVELAPGQRRIITVPLNYQVNELNQLMLLSDGSFNWTLLGFNVGDTIIITEVSGTNSYSVFSYTPNLIVLNPIGFTPVGSGNAVFTLDYPITNVGYTNRTNEGYDLIEGVLLPEKYSNLNYSIKRNIQRWFPYLATCTKYISGKKIKNTLFKINGDLVTRKTGEVENIVDKADIIVNDIADLKILDPIIYNVNVFADFTQATQLFKDVRDLKGFIRVQLNSKEVVKGYVKEADYEYSTGKLSLELEKKYETDFLQITNIGSDVYVNGVLYANMSYNINNNFVCLYDSELILIHTATDFNFIEINGQRFTDVDDFSDALALLLT